MYSYVSPALLLTVTFVLLCTRRRPKWPGVPPNQMYKILETPSRLRVLPSTGMPLLCVALLKFKRVFCTMRVAEEHILIICRNERNGMERNLNPQITFTSVVLLLVHF